VVVTHFAPSLRSADPRYGLTPGTAGFCNALDDRLPHADLWLHGHLHCAHDYRVEGEAGGRPFSCRVVANPLGYASKGEQAEFRPELVIELPD
ncbi:MAG TPA: metallophosphoesterase, partial [Burkholderiaceae bacterium]